jgi:hypothetical protein
VTLKFSDLNPLGRAIIIVVAALTFGVAAVSFATSYGALYAYARDTGLYTFGVAAVRIGSPASGRCCWTGRSSLPSWPPSWPASCAAPAAGPSSPC